MVININNLFNSRNKNSKMADFQDLDHINGVSIATTSANLYNKKRDDLVLFYFRNGANYASVYTQSKIVSENIKWNSKIKSKKIKAILINTRNANVFSGKKGFQGLKIIAQNLSEELSTKQKEDEENPQKVKPNEILFSCTGTIGEPFPTDKIRICLPDLIKKIKYTQNKYIWMKAAMGIITTDLKPKLAMEECKIGKSNIKIYGIAKGSGMIFPNMATTLGFIFTDANLSSSMLKQALKKNITTTFNAISCDGDTSTNDMVSIFATRQTKNFEIKNINDPILKKFNESLHTVLLNLAKRVAADGEGASKFITVNTINCKSNAHARKISFSIANSPLVKTALAGEDPNWGRIVMAIGKSNEPVNINKLKIKIGDQLVTKRGSLNPAYEEEKAKKYLKNKKIKILIDLGVGSRESTITTCDLTKKYIDINTDYRS